MTCSRKQLLGGRQIQGFTACRVGILLPGWMAFFLGPSIPFPIAMPRRNIHPSEQNELSFPSGGKESLLYFGGWQLKEKVTHVKGQLPPADKGKSLKGSFRGVQADGGACMQKQQ